MNIKEAFQALRALLMPRDGTKSFGIAATPITRSTTMTPEIVRELDGRREDIRDPELLAKLDVAKQTMETDAQREQQEREQKAIEERAREEERARKAVAAAQREEILKALIEEQMRESREPERNDDYSQGRERSRGFER